MKYAPLLGIALLSLQACSSYVNSPRVAAARAESVKSFSDPIIARAYHAKPTMRFPARIGLAPLDTLATEQLRELDAAGKLEMLKKLPQMASCTTVSSLLISAGDDKQYWNKNDLIIREAAAKLHADAVLLLRVETSITDGKLFSPLTTFSLGMFPNNRAEVIATAMAALVDTKTGYVYGTLERSAGKTCFTNSWDDFTRDRTVGRAANQAVTRLFSEIPDFWSGVVQAHRR